MASRSLRRTLMLWLLIPLLCLIIIDSSILYRFAMHFQRGAFDNALHDSANDIAQIIAEAKDPNNRFKLKQEVRNVILSDQQDRMYYSIINMDGVVVGGDRDLGLLMPERTSSRQVYYSDSSIGGQPIRVVTMLANISDAMGKQKVYVQVAETLNKRKQLARDILFGIIFPQLVLLLAAVALLCFGINRGLRPLWMLQAALVRRSHRDLSPVQLADVPDEVKALLDAVNFLMQQLKNVLESQNRFIADAAHQLRTPLAGMQAQLELLQGEHDSAEQQSGLVRVTNSVERLSHLVNQLLTLARNQPEAAPTFKFEPVDLAQLIQATATEMVPAALQKNIDLGFEQLQAHPVMIEGDPQRLKELLSNLLDNAIRYSHNGDKVTVSLEDKGQQVELAVEDNGPGIPQEEQHKVFERFHRVVGNGQEGSGLGLAIVLEIAQIHHAKVAMQTPEDGVGTRISVIFDVAGKD